MNLNVINVTYPQILRAAGTQQTNNGLLYAPPPMVIGGETVHRKGLTLVRWDIQNLAAAANIGIGFRYRNAIWRVGRLSGDGATYTDVTTTAQSTSPVTLQVAGANQTGFAIGCKKPMAWVSVNFTTAETNAGGGTVVDHTVTYSQGAAWSSAVASAGCMNAAATGFIFDNTVYSAVVHEMVWSPPTDWTVSASLGGVPDGYYWLRFTSDEREAGDVAAIATGIEVGTLYARNQIAQYGILASERAQYYEPDADGVVGFFSIANALNLVYAEVLA